MSSATIKLFLPHGDPKRLRTAEISNWNGKAVAAPRTDLGPLLARDELKQSGVYLLIGDDAATGRPTCYVGEAEVIRDRLKQHKDKEWHGAMVFVSKDENLTKSHIRYLEGRLIELALAASRAKCVNAQSSGARLPESDREDMEVFLAKISQLLPVLGSDVLTPMAQLPFTTSEPPLLCEIKGLTARGRRTPNGFVVLSGSQAVLENRPSAQAQHPFVVARREQLVADGSLVQQENHYVFSRDVEFTSASGAASAVHGGGTNGLLAWRDSSGRSLRDIEG